MRTPLADLRRALALALALSLVAPSAFAQAKKAEKSKAGVAPAPALDPNAIDYDALTRIRWEAFHNSKVMDTIFELTDRIGPRVTNSPNEKRASAWTREQLTAWGLENVHAEAWGPFGRGWSYETARIKMTAPDVAELIALPKAWSRGTDGVVRGKITRTKINSIEDFAKYKGKLAGAIILNGEIRKLTVNTNAKLERYDDNKLREYNEFRIPADRTNDPRAAEYARRYKFLREFARFLEEEKVAVLLESSRGYDGGTIVVQGNGRAYKKDEPLGPAMLVLAAEHFNRMARLADKNIPVEVELEVKTTFHENNGDAFGYNSIAELAGSDLKGEVVMLGAHIDSWHGATGATDNAAGVAVMMEAMRILKATGLKPRRTVRLALWTGEEIGLLGSSGYVREHFAERTVREDGDYEFLPADARPLVSLKTKPEHEKISLYLNVDSGTGKIRGVSIQENQSLEPIFRQWMEPLRDLGVSTTSMRTTNGSDFVSFDRVGIPAVELEQDPVEYESLTWHTNMDTLDRIQREDVMQAAAVVAAMAYHAAMRDQLMPRKPLPQPQPAAGATKTTGRP